MRTAEEVMKRFAEIEFSEEFDILVAIANGGIVPAGILAQRLERPVYLLRINLRDKYQQPKFDTPQLLTPIDFEYKEKRILLIEDRVKTGASLRMAKDLLQGASMIKTFAVNGEADYALFNETCFRFPWII